MPRTVDHAARSVRRRAILDVAGGLFAERGYDATPVTDIAAAAGVSSGTVFHHFGSKDAVFRALFADDGPRNRELVERAHADPDPVSAVLGILDGIAADVTDSAAPGLLIELVRRVAVDPELVLVVEEVDDIVRRGLTEQIDRAVAAGLADPGVESSVAAGWLMSVVDGAYLSAGGPDTARSPELVRLTALRFLRMALP